MKETTLALLLLSTLLSGCYASSNDDLPNRQQLRPLESLSLAVEFERWVGLENNATLSYNGTTKEILAPWGSPIGALAFELPDHEKWIAIDPDSWTALAVSPEEGWSGTSYFARNLVTLQDTGMFIGLAMIGDTAAHGTLDWWGISLEYAWDHDRLLLQTPMQILIDDVMEDLTIYMALDFVGPCPIPTKSWFWLANEDGPTEPSDRDLRWASHGTCTVSDGPAPDIGELPVPMPEQLWDQAPPSGQPDRLPEVGPILDAAKIDARTAHAFEQDDWILASAAGQASPAPSWTLTIEREGRTVEFQGTEAQGRGLILSVTEDAADGTGRSSSASPVPMLSFAQMESVCSNLLGNQWGGTLDYSDFAGPGHITIDGGLNAGSHRFSCSGFTLTGFDSTTGWLLRI